jgi:hypothetical protein
MLTLRTAIVEGQLTKSIHSRQEKARGAESMSDNDKASEVLSRSHLTGGGPVIVAGLLLMPLRRWPP